MERLYASSYIADTVRDNLLNCISVKRLRRLDTVHRLLSRQRLGCSMIVKTRSVETLEQTEARLQYDREYHRETCSVETLEQQKLGCNMIESTIGRHVPLRLWSSRS